MNAAQHTETKIQFMNYALWWIITYRILIAINRRFESGSSYYPLDNSSKNARERKKKSSANGVLKLVYISIQYNEYFPCVYYGLCASRMDGKCESISFVLS